jgi:hypothetical protein
MRQIAGGGRDGESPSDALASRGIWFSLPGDHLDPAQSFLDPFADALAG